MTLQRLQEIVHHYADTGKNLESAFRTSLDYVKVCLLFTEIFRAHCRPEDPPTFELIDDWRGLWKLTVAALKRYRDSEDSGHKPGVSRDLALATLRDLKLLKVELMELVASGKTTARIVIDLLPHDLFVTLASFIPDSDLLEPFSCFERTAPNLVQDNVDATAETHSLGSN